MVLFSRGCFASENRAIEAVPFSWAHECHGNIVSTIILDSKSEAIGH